MRGSVQRWCAVLVLAASVSASCAAKQLAVIVDKANPVSSMSVAELTKVFKFDNRKWPDGRNVVLVLPEASSPEMQAVIEKLYHMQPDEVKALLAGHRAGVVIASSEEQMLKSVETIPGAVGIVDVYSITSRVNVIKVDGKLPLEQGYFLKASQ